MISDLGKWSVESKTAENNPTRCRCGAGEVAGRASSSKSDCYKFGTWHVRSLFQVGKLAGIVQEMERTDLDLLGISETFWNDSGEFKTTIPTSDNIYKVIHSGGSNNRKGVAFIASKKVANAIKYYELRTERIICLKIQAKPTDLTIIQVYAPNENANDTEKDIFYEEVNLAIKEHKKYRDQLIIMGDFNAKVCDREEKKIIGKFGLGDRNDHGETSRTMPKAKLNNLKHLV